MFWTFHRTDDNDWVKRCVTWEVEGIRQRGRPRMTWWDCVKNDFESLGQSQKDPGKVAVKTVCVCVCVRARV